MRQPGLLFQSGLGKEVLFVNHDHLSAISVHFPVSARPCCYMLDGLYLQIIKERNARGQDEDARRKSSREQQTGRDFRQFIQAVTNWTASDSRLNFLYAILHWTPNDKFQSTVKFELSDMNRGAEGKFMCDRGVPVPVTL